MITVILATYNGEKYIRDQLDSLFKGTYKDFRIFAQDDGSLDATVSILKEYGERYDGQVFVHENEINRRSAGNFYTGLIRANEELSADTDYFMFCDQDDVWDPDKMEKTLSKMHKMEEEYGKDTPLLVFTDSRLTDTEGNVTAPSFQALSHFNSKALDLPHLLMENKAPGCTMMINMPLFEVIRNGKSSDFVPSSMRMHDWWFMIAAAAFGHIGFLNEATMSYRQHGGNVVGGEDFKAYVKEKAANKSGAKESLKLCIEQGKDFYETYKGMSRYDDVLSAFAGLGADGFFEKRAKLLKYGFFKSGLLRNVGVFLLI